MSRQERTGPPDERRSVFRVRGGGARLPATGGVMSRASLQGQVSLRPGMDSGRPSVLVVDDVEANLVAVRALLDGLDCEVIVARTGNEALRFLLKREFAVL